MSKHAKHPSNDRFTRFPAELAAKARTVRLPGEPSAPAGIPALLAHPDWKHPAPTVLWLHGRTVSKELDPGRYLRWVRAGVAACAIDLPGHGERAGRGTDAPAKSLDVMETALGEIDRVVEALADPAWKNVFDLDRLGIGGMSLGGMVTLRRLCDEHPFRAASVEGTTGWLTAQYFPRSTNIPELATLKPWPVDHPREKVDRLDPMKHLAGFRPLPMLVLHSEADKVVSWAVQRRFVEALKAHFRTRPENGPGAETTGASVAGPGAAAGSGAGDLVLVKTWPATGAPEEHSGFGKFSNDAKNLQTEFFARELGAGAARGTP